LVSGRLEGEGVIDFDLDGRHAVTLYRAVAHARTPDGGAPGAPAASSGAGGSGGPSGGGGGDGCGWVTRVHLWPKTGRTHQVRPGEQIPCAAPSRPAGAAAPNLGPRRRRASGLARSLRGPSRPPPAARHPKPLQLRKHLAYLGHPILGERQYKHRRKEGISLAPCPIGPLLATMTIAREDGAAGCGGARGGGSGGGLVCGPAGAAAAAAAVAPAAAAAAAGGGGRKEAGVSGDATPQAPAAAAEQQQGGACGQGRLTTAESMEEDGVADGGEHAVATAAQPLCLWAVELSLHHPVDRGRPLHFLIPDPPAYDELCPLP
jgi:hypothetical protein